MIAAGTSPSHARPQESPIVWVSEYLIAIDRDDHSRAERAESELARLGWRLCRCTPSGCGSPASAA